MGGDPPQQLPEAFSLSQGEAAIAAAIGAKAEGQQPVIHPGTAFHGHGSCPIPEEHAGAPIAPIHPATELVGPNHQGTAHASRADVLGGGDEGEEEATAGGREVEGHGMVGTKGGLHPRGGAKEVVWAGGGQQDQIQGFRFPAGMAEGRVGRFRRQGGHRLPRAGQPPGANARAAADPGIGGVHQGAEGIVAHMCGGQSPSRADDGHPLKVGGAAVAGSVLRHPWRSVRISQSQVAAGAEPAPRAWRSSIT